MVWDMVKFAPTLYLSDCHRHSDASPWPRYVNPHALFRCIGVLRRVLGAQKIHWKGGGEYETETNGIRETYDTFLSRALQAGFGCTVIFNTSKEAYPWPSILLHRCCWANFAKAHWYIKIGVAIFIGCISKWTSWAWCLIRTSCHVAVSQLYAIQWNIIWLGCLAFTFPVYTCL